ncbi:MAG: tRNA (adenosine(37)-N6)-threonylcarbamoyltransferase complex dimerization subunit type 1 TsaB [Aestuariivita sp.]|nr:tRNA (adenosine(37)-N6)-threonylcarbamoyltransferase complex dimerization subunit type 1 TsaB [Aestuariivita sp.]
MTVASGLLAFDTSAAHCAAALLSAGCVSVMEKKMVRGQAENLLPMLCRLLSDANLDFTDLQGIGVGIGPGNFTGVRISVSAARGLGFGLQIPVIGVSTLEALAWGFSSPVLAAVPARREQIYAQLFGVEEETTPLLCSPTFADLHDLVGELRPPVVGAAAKTVAEHTNWMCAEPNLRLIEAVLQIAKARFDQNLLKEMPTPIYLRAATDQT